MIFFEEHIFVQVLFIAMGTKCAPLSFFDQWVFGRGGTFYKSNTKIF